MRSDAILGNNARRLHSQQQLGLTVAFVQTQTLGEVVLIQVAHELFENHHKAQKTHGNYQRLFPGQKIMLWGDQSKPNQAAFAAGELLEGVLEILAVPLDWLSI